MRLFPARPPAWVADLRPRLDERERPLAWAAYAGGRLLATTRALWTVPDGGEPRRVFWDEVERATWRDGRLVVRLQASGAETAYDVTEPGSLPPVVRERVTGSIVVNTTHRLPTGGGLRIVARRRGGEGALRWTAVFERERDAADPAARAEADRLLAQAREAAGD